MTKASDTTTEDKILEAARVVFFEKGYAATRTQEIADRAGINKALLHYYYRSKEKLFRRILTEAMDEMIPSLTASLVGEKDVLGKLEDLVHNHLEVLLERPYLPMFVMHELGQNQGQFMREQAQKRQAAPALLAFVQQIAEETASGKIRPVHPLHLMLNAMSMVIFPFMARPMVGALADLPKDTFENLMEGRKEAIVSFLRHALKP